MDKHYCCSDFHGMYELWSQIRDYCDDTDTIYFLGDACDRGPDGMKIMLELLLDDRVQYIMGNHEEFVLRAILYEEFDLWTMNGGYETIKDFSKLSNKEILKLKEQLENMPIELNYINTKGQKIILNHSGYIKNGKTEMITFGDFNPYLWDRRQLTHPWENKGQYIIHGHSPVQFLREELNSVAEFYNRPLIPTDIIEVTEYCDGHKIDIDLGSYNSHKAALFDLDELKVEKYFYTEE
jgi:serine/threonine protein phosphatase 1